MPPTPLQLLLVVLMLGVGAALAAAASGPAPARPLFVPSLGPPAPPAQAAAAKGRGDGDRRRGAWDFVPSPRDPYLDALEGHAVQPAAAPEDNALRVGWPAAAVAALGAPHAHSGAAPEFNVHLHAPGAAPDLHAPHAAPQWDHASAALAAAAPPPPSLTAALPAALAAAPPPPPPPSLTAALALATPPVPAPAPDAPGLLPLPRAFHNPHTFHSVVNYGHINLHHGDHYEPHNNGKAPDTDAAPIKQALPPGLRALKALDALAGPARKAPAEPVAPPAPATAPAADPSDVPGRDVEPLDATAFPGDLDDAGRTEPPK